MIKYSRGCVWGKPIPMTGDTGTEKRIYGAVMISAKREDIVIARAFLSQSMIRYCFAVVGGEGYG